MVAEEARSIEWPSSASVRIEAKWSGGSTALETERGDHSIGRPTGLDLTQMLLTPIEKPHDERRQCTARKTQDHGLDKVVGHHQVVGSGQAGDTGQWRAKCEIELPIINTDRTVGTILSATRSPRKWPRALSARRHDSLQIQRLRRAEFWGVSGEAASRSSLEGDANDYVGKGLSGGRIVVIYPPKQSSSFVPEENNYRAGNVCSVRRDRAGKAFYPRPWRPSGFAVRNSGAHTVDRRRRRPRLRVYDRGPRGDCLGPDGAQLSPPA